MTDAPEDLKAVREQLREIQHRKRGGIRWQLSRHTAELALGALASAGPARGAAAKSSKQRRRKRAKRLL